MQLIAWICLCAAVAFLLRRHLTSCLVLVLALLFLVPTVGSYLLTGHQTGPLSFHAASWLILAIACVQVMENPAALRRAAGRHAYLFLVLLLVLSVSFLTTRTVQTGGGMVLFLDQMVTPAVFFLLVLAAGIGDERLVFRLRNTLLVLAAAVTVVAVCQWWMRNVLFYEAGFKTQFWFNPDTERWMGTFDQPLALSMVLCVLAPLVAGIRRLYVALPLLSLMVVGVVITQSRVGMALVLLGVLYAVVFSRHRATVKAVLLAALGTGFYILLMSPLVEGILRRLENDTGSAEARNKAYADFFRNWREYLFTGDGLTASYGVADFAGLQTSYESSILMYAVDIGIVFAVLYFGALFALVVRNAGRHSVPGLTAAALLAVLVPQTYSGVATRSVAGIVVWTVVAMTVLAVQEAAAWKRSRSAGFEGRPEIRTSAGADAAAAGAPAAGGRAPVRESTWIGR